MHTSNSVRGAKEGGAISRTWSMQYLGLMVGGCTLDFLRSALYMAAPSFKHNSRDDTVWLPACTGCLKHDNPTWVAKELGVDIGVIRCSSNLEHWHKLLLKISTQMLHLYCLWHCLYATDPASLSSIMHLSVIICTIFDVDYVVGTYYFCPGYNTSWPQEIACENFLATKKWTFTGCTCSASLQLQLQRAHQRHAQYCLLWIINMQTIGCGTEYHSYGIHNFDSIIYMYIMLLCKMTHCYGEHPRATVIV